MNFLKIIKNEINEPNRRYGSNGKVLVPARELFQLIEHFERLDSSMRLTYHSKNEMEYFIDAVRCMYANSHKDATQVFITLARTLEPLIEEDKRMRMAKRNILRGDRE